MPQRARIIGRRLPSSTRQAHDQAVITLDRKPRSTSVGIAVQHASESVSSIRWNRCPASIGLRNPLVPWLGERQPSTCRRMRRYRGSRRWCLGCLLWTAALRPIRGERLETLQQLSLR